MALVFSPIRVRKFLPVDLDSDSDEENCHVPSYFGSSTTLSSNTDNSDEAEDNFNVVLRVRPPNAQERNRRDQFAVDFPGDGQVSVNNQGTVRSFQFNVVLEPDAAQEDVFESSGMKKLIESAIMGYTCTAFAFGQTGSGKTHTMTGPPAQNVFQVPLTKAISHST
ncbi:kinesin-like protein [Elysia marginata]|uniref:Kinesin-like protein n=1 Tax=Elysia marginata TaxID=1093978 RepID=A0AAV4IUH3_9GAST|nr:kinesin-like protein [Elysia marginata]